MNREKDEQIARLGPKAEFYDQFASSDGLYGIQNAARVLNEPPNKFSRRLKDEGYLFYQGGALVPYRRWREKGIFEVKAQIVDEKARYRTWIRSEEHTSELQSLMRHPYAVFCLKKK